MSHTDAQYSFEEIAPVIAVVAVIVVIDIVTLIAVLAVKVVLAVLVVMQERKNCNGSISCNDVRSIYC